MVRNLMHRLGLSNACVFFFVALMALVFGISDNAVFATTTADDITTITIRPSCSMTATVTSEHTATMMGGTYSGTSEYPDGIGSTTIQTFCNDTKGYAIYAIGYTNNEEGNTVLKGGTGLTSNDDIVTGTATSGTSGNDVSNWAMKLTAVSGTYTPTIMNGFGSFSSVPSSYTEVAKLDRATDLAGGTNIGSTITTTYAAYISNSQPAGTYTGQVKYVLVHPDYNVSSARIMQNIAEWEDELLPEVQVTAIDNRDNTEYTVAKMKDGNIWMTQNLDLCIGCTGTATLTSENTDLNEYDTNGDGTGTIFDGYSINNGIVTWTPTGSTMTGSPAVITDIVRNDQDNDLVTGWVNKADVPYMADGKDAIIYNRAIYQTTTEGGVTTTALQKCIADGNTEALCKHNQNGNYYNFSAAVAMNNTYAYNAQYTVMPNSICPAGWRLPKGLTQVADSTVNISEVDKLLNNYNIANGSDTTGGVNVGYASGGFDILNDAPLYYTRAGLVQSGGFLYAGSHGDHWSSTLVDSSKAYYFAFTGAELFPVYQGPRNNGRSVRCLHEPTTMQSVSKSDLNTLMPIIGDTIKLRDNRDNTEYTIGKLADGNYWMLDNLALDPATLKPGVALNSSNTNMADGATFTLPNSTTDFTSYTEARIETGHKNNTADLALGQSGTGKVGVYYNYCAATAGTYCKSEDHTDTDDAEYDICPKGWRMPTGGDKGEYKALRNKYASNEDFVLALRAPYSAYFHIDHAAYRNIAGGYWASTYGTSPENMGGLWINPELANPVRPANTHDRKYGFPIRCIYDQN